MGPRLHVATRKGLFTVERRGDGAWRVAAVHFLGDEVTALLHDPRSRHLHAALRLGHFGVKIHVSGDGGKTFVEAAPPTFPARPEDAGDDVAWTVGQVWTLEAGTAAEAGVLWAGTLPGGLFRSADGGASWQLVRSLWDRPERRRWSGGGFRQPGLHSISIDPRDGRRLLVAVSVGGVWASRDGGASWEAATSGMRAPYMPPELLTDPAAQDPHRLARCPAAPDIVWCQHHGGVYLSRNGGRSWLEVQGVPPSTFGFAVAVHPRDPELAWLVPAVSDACRFPAGGHLVVARTEDGGASWRELSHGLPSEHAYHLVLRHALAVDADGERLALGTNLGGLWVSEDRGESWRRVPADLPPVNAVRFAG